MTTLRISALREQRLLMTKSSIAQPQKMSFVLLGQSQGTLGKPKYNMVHLSLGKIAPSTPKNSP